MKILITSDSTFTMVSGQPPEVGSKYALEEAESATGEQNRLFHALVTEYWSSGLSSSQATSYEAFRDDIKLKLGAGFEKLVYADLEDGKAVIVTVTRLDEVPQRILKDSDLKRMVLAKLKSWSAYTKKERTQTIDRLIVEMHQSGVNSKKFEEILSGVST